MFLFVGIAATGANVIEDRIEHLAWMLADGRGALQELGGGIVRPDGFARPGRAEPACGILADRALNERVPMPVLLRGLAEAAGKADCLVAHDLRLHKAMLARETDLHRTPPFTFGRREFCTMREATAWCALPGTRGRGYTPPGLGELHRKVFGKPLSDAHDPLARLAACMHIFFELKRRGVFTVPESGATAARTDDAARKIPPASPRHKSRHVLGGMHVHTERVLKLIHDGFDAAEKYGRNDIADLSESLLSVLSLVSRYRVAYIYQEAGDILERLEKLLKQVGQERH